MTKQIIITGIVERDVYLFIENYLVSADFQVTMKDNKRYCYTADNHLLSIAQSTVNGSMLVRAPTYYWERIVPVMRLNASESQLIKAKRKKQIH